MSELDQEIDACGPCAHCGQAVHEVGSTICDDCDPDRQINATVSCDAEIPFD